MPRNVPMNLVGQRYGRLVVIDSAPTLKPGRTRWLCRCDCGTVKPILAYCLRAKVSPTVSCGCYHQEIQHTINLKHGGAAIGSSNRLLYSMWQKIKGRCLNSNDPNFKHYGGRGITIAAEWRDDFPAFQKYIVENLGPKPDPTYSIDRIDNDAGYFAGNLRWGSRKQQANNQRRRRLPEAEEVCGRPCLDRHLRNEPCRNRIKIDGGPCWRHR